MGLGDYLMTVSEYLECIRALDPAQLKILVDEVRLLVQTLEVRR